MSVRDIARKAGVSITTVSRALNNHESVRDEVRRRVLAVANALGYVPHVGKRSTSNVALLYTGEMFLGSPFDAALLQGLAGELAHAGLDLVLLHAERSRQPGETHTQMLMRKGVRGAIVRTDARTRDICPELAREGFPMVVVADHFDDARVCTVRCDARAAARRGMDLLLAGGHRRIALCMNVVDDHDHLARRLVWEEALREAGVGLDERLVVRVAADLPGGAQVLRQIMRLADRPTVVFVTDPLVAVGLIHEAARTGVSVPADLSVLGFDDGQHRFVVHPQMTCVCQDAELLGREAFLALQQQMQQRRSKPPCRALQAWLEVHDTVAPPPVVATAGSRGFPAPGD